MNTLAGLPRPEREMNVLRRAWLRAVRVAVAVLIVSGALAAIVAAWATSASVRDLRGLLFG